MAEVALTRRAAIPAAGEGYTPIGHSVSDWGHALSLFVESGAKELVTEQFHDDIGVFPRPSATEKASFRLIQSEGHHEKWFDLPPLDLTFPLFDVFPDGRVLIAGSRCQWRSPEDYDLNGVVFDPKTGTCSRILLGDGIENLSIDRRGRIWVSYFDEGIFGNFGWGGPGPEPIGASGLNCFDDRGNVLWSFYSNRSGYGMCDCYATNVSGLEVNFYYYTEFPMCRISEDFQERFWETGLKGCRYFAVSKTHALFSGQYDDPESLHYLLRFDGDRLRRSKCLELTLPDGGGLSGGFATARGSKVHYFDDSGWYQADIDELET